MAGNITESNALYGISKPLALIGGYKSQTATGNITLDGTYGNLIRIDPGGSSRDVTLPAEATSSGLFYIIVNGADAAENLVIKDDGGSTIATLAQLESGIFHCNGSAWSIVVQIDAQGSPLTADTISEATAAAGVTIDGVLLKDGGVVLADGATIDADIVAEATAGAGVTVDGCLIKDGYAAGIATASMFASTEQTGTGSEQNVAHGLSGTPRLVWTSITEDDGNAIDIAYGTHDGTNLKFTTGAAVKFRAFAIL